MTARNACGPCVYDYLGGAGNASVSKDDAHGIPGGTCALGTTPLIVRPRRQLFRGQTNEDPARLRVSRSLNVVDKRDQVLRPAGVPGRSDLRLESDQLASVHNKREDDRDRGDYLSPGYNV